MNPPADLLTDLEELFMLLIILSFTFGATEPVVISISSPSSVTLNEPINRRTFLYGFTAEGRCAIEARIADSRMSTSFDDLPK